MSEWVSQAEISARLGYKILIAGLSEAGKTAVKRIFFLKQKTEDVDSLSATINYERMSVTIRDTPINIVDLGGQKIFLKRFLSGFSPFVFSSVHTFIFLIDTANRTSMNNAIDYFSSCVAKLKEFSPDAELFVFLHKNDLVINSPNYESIHEQFKERFQLETERKLRFFRTTIYKPETVINAFGRIFELVIPEISQSEFVDGQKIGMIEEYHKETMTMTRADTKVKEVQYAEVTPHAPKLAGDPAILNRLQFLMKQAVKTGSNSSIDQPSEQSIFLGNAATEESSSEAVLTHIDKEETKIPTIQTIPSSEELIQEMNEVESLKPISTTTSSPPITPITPTTSAHKVIPAEDKKEVSEPSGAIKQFDIETNQKINHIMEFYRIDQEKATEIVDSGYSELFEMAVTVGIPISLVSDILLKYIPFIKKSVPEESFQNINQERLQETLYEYLKGKLKEQDIVKCLIISVEKPRMSIESIVNNYFKVEKEPKEIIEKKEPMVEEKIIAKAIPKTTQFEIPIEADSLEGIINLPGTEGMGFKIDFIEPDRQNLKLTLHLQGPLGQQELIGSSITSVNIKIDEIVYLLAYELNLADMGVFEGGINSMQFAAKIIYETIKEIKEKSLHSSKEIPKELTRKGKGKHLTETVKFQIPLEIQFDGDYISIPDSEKLAFKVEKAPEKFPGFTLSFIQRGYPIGQVNVIKTITKEQLEKLLKEAMPLPIESEGSLDFAVRIIHGAINDTLKDKSKIPHIKIPSDKEPILTTTEDEAEASEELKYYLDLLKKS